MLVPNKIFANFPVEIRIPEGPYLEMDGWLMSVYLRGPAEVTVDGVLVDTHYHFSVTATVAGLYTYSIVAENGLSRVLIETGQVTVKPDPSAIVTGTDTRLYQERLIAAIESVLEGKITKDASSYSIAGRSITKIPIQELLDTRDKLKRELSAITGKAKPRLQRVRFT